MHHMRASHAALIALSQFDADDSKAGAALPAAPAIARWAAERAILPPQLRKEKLNPVARATQILRARFTLRFVISVMRAGAARGTVMPGLVPGIHVFEDCQAMKTWMAGPTPAEGLTKRAQ